MSTLRPRLCPRQSYHPDVLNVFLFQSLDNIFSVETVLSKRCSYRGKKTSTNFGLKSAEKSFFYDGVRKGLTERKYLDIAKAPYI